MVAAGALLAALLPSVVLGDTPTGAIAGTVFGPTGQPAAGLSVIACVTTCGGAMTAADGTYTIAGLAAGGYRLDVQDLSGTLPTGYVTTGGLTPVGPLAAVFQVGTTSVHLDIHVPAGHRISGTVTAAGGGAIAGIRLFVCGAINGVMPGTGVVYCGHATTASDGTYSVAAVPGSYTVYFADFSSTYADGYYSTSGFTPDRGAATPVTVGTSDVSGIDVALPTAVIYSGSLGGTVTDSASAPVSGIDVMACSVAATATSGCTGGQTATDGTYQISLAPGSYAVSFSDSGAAHPAGFYGASGFTANLASAQSVTVGTSAVTGIDVQLPAGHLVKGTVTGPGGTPLGGIAIAVCASPVCGAATLTASDGTYTVNLAAGSYTLHFMDWSGQYLSGYYSTSGLASAAGATPVTVAGADVTGINVALHGITAGLHAGTAHSGSFSATKTVVARSGTYVTARFWLGKGFAHSAVPIFLATKGASGPWSAYRRATSRPVSSDGYAYYTVRVRGWVSFEAGVTDPGGVGAEVFSGYVRARGI